MKKQDSLNLGFVQTRVEGTYGLYVGMYQDLVMDSSIKFLRIVLLLLLEYYFNVTGPVHTSCDSRPGVAPREVQFMGIVMQFQPYYSKRCTSSICYTLLK